jgi:hypothetical protein
MTFLTSLKLVSGQKGKSVAPIVVKRNKLISQLHHQLMLCEAKRNGNTYAPKHLRSYTNKLTGERMTVEKVKRIREWFWVAENGKINLAIKYGARTIPLNKKGANAIELSDNNELVKALAELKLATANGEFDEALEEVSNTTRTAFRK